MHYHGEKEASDIMRKYWTKAGSTFYRETAICSFIYNVKVLSGLGLPVLLSEDAFSLALCMQLGLPDIPQF